MLVLVSTISVPNFMLVSKSAQFASNFELCRRTVRSFWLIQQRKTTFLDWTMGLQKQDVRTYKSAVQARPKSRVLEAKIKVWSLFISYKENTSLSTRYTDNVHPIIIQCENKAHINLTQINKILVICLLTSPFTCLSKDCLRMLTELNRIRV